MAIDVSTLTTYTDAELLTLYRWALANGAAGQTRSIGGRSMSFPGNKDLRETIEWLEKRTGADDTGGGHVLVEYGERA